MLRVGVNGNIRHEKRDQALGETAWGATSLTEVLGRDIDRVTFAATLFTCLGRRDERVRGSGGKAIMQEWNARSCLGQRARSIEPGRSLEGIAEDIDAGGCLLVRFDDGSLLRVVEGELLPLPSR